MRKILAVLFACSIVLAGCMGSSDDDVDEIVDVVDEIVDAVVDLPECNDETSYNYDENASNNLACFTEAMLKQSVTEFANLLNSDGVEWGETVGIKTDSRQTDSSGDTASFTSTVVTSPDGMYVYTKMTMGFVVIEMGELMTENPDGTTNIVSIWMGDSFQMNSEMVFDDFYNAESFADLRNDSADDSNDDGDLGDLGLGLPDTPDTDVGIPGEFNPAEALYEAGLATDNGYEFTTTLNIDDNYTNVMTFILSPEFTVTELTMDETWTDGSSAVSTITVLDDATASALLTKDESLNEHALPFSVMPMGGMDNHDDHDDDHGDHDDDHGDHDDDHGDHDGEMVCYDEVNDYISQINDPYECQMTGWDWISADEIDNHGNDHGDHDDEIYWTPYYGGYCEWEGNPSDDDNVWSCKYDESDNEWDTWWYYCELHGDDWFCTDNLGQNPEHENSAGNSQYDHTEDGHDEEDVFFDAYLTDNYASIDDQYVNPEFRILSGFDIIVEVDFELLDSDYNQIASMMVYPDDFSETIDGYMVYYFPLDYESLADGCYTLAAGVTTSTDQYHQYERYDICINTHSEGDETAEVDGIEEQYSTVAELYEAWGDILSTNGANCVGCEGNLAAMTADSTIDITDQASFESVAGMYDDYYFQFIDENGNGMYDAEEIYAVSCENVDGDDEQRAVVAYDGGYYANYEDTGAYMFEQFWSDAYDFSWSTSDSGNNDNSDNHDDGQGDGDGHDNGDNHDDGDGHDNGDDDGDDDHHGHDGHGDGDGHDDGNNDDDGNGDDHSDDDDGNGDDHGDDDHHGHDGHGDGDGHDDGDNDDDGNGDDHGDDDHHGHDGHDDGDGHGDDDNHDDGNGDDHGDDDHHGHDGHGDGDGHDDGDEMDDEDGMLSEEDFFAAADSDNDGLVSSQDIIDAFMAGDAPTPQEALDEGDVDNSEGISWDEFVAMWNADEDEGDDQHLDYNAELKSAFNDAFNNSDVDSTGELSIDELQAFIDEVVSLASTDEDDDGEFASIIDMMVNCVDDDGDGLLDQMEFSTFYTNLDSGGDSIAMIFCMFDTDGNDLVTASEYAAYMNQSGFYDDDPMSDEEWAGFVSMFSYYDVDDIEGLDIVEFEDMMSDDGDDDNHGDHDHGDHDHGDHDDDHGDHDDGDHYVQLDWEITSADMLTSGIEVAGSFADYHIVLASCTMDEGPDEDGNMDLSDMLDTNAMTCGEDVMKVSMAQATSVGADIMFHDADGSGTITEGDMIHINPDLDAGGDWNMVRLYSEPADSYSDENPMLPGFGAVAGIIALLGAALLTRRD